MLYLLSHMHMLAAANSNRSKHYSILIRPVHNIFLFQVYLIIYLYYFFSTIYVIPLETSVEITIEGVYFSFPEFE